MATPTSGFTPQQLAAMKADRSWKESTVPFYYDAAGNRIATMGFGPGAMQFNLDTGSQYAPTPTGQAYRGEGGEWIGGNGYGGMDESTYRQAAAQYGWPQIAPAQARPGGYEQVWTHDPDPGRTALEKIWPYATAALGGGAIAGSLGATGGAGAGGAAGGAGGAGAGAGGWAVGAGESLGGGLGSAFGATEGGLGSLFSGGLGQLGGNIGTRLGLSGLPANMAGNAIVGSGMGGLSSGLRGGNIFSGMLGGALTGGLGAGLGAIPGFSSLPSVARGAISGGLGSAITGGNPLSGALSGGLGGLGGEAFSQMGLPSGLGSALTKGAYGLYKANDAKQDYMDRAQMLSLLRRRGAFPQRQV